MTNKEKYQLDGESLNDVLAVAESVRWGGFCPIGELTEDERDCEYDVTDPYVTCRDCILNWLSLEAKEGSA